MIHHTTKGMLWFRLYEGGPGKALLAANCFEICNAKK